MTKKKIKPPICPYCKCEAELVSSLRFYRTDFGKLWACPTASCDARVGVHKGSPVYAPVGSLANGPLRLLRKMAHESFDPLWKSGRVSRIHAYHLLTTALRRDRMVHIGFMDEADCRATIRVIPEILAKLDKPTATEAG